MCSPIRAAVATVVVVAALLAAAPTASAKVHFAQLGGRVLQWDQRASSTILGCPGNPSCRDAVQGITVHLRRGPASRGAIVSRGLIRLGPISASGTIAFRVPRVSPGRFHLVARVPAGERRRWSPVSGTFRIRQR